MPDLGSYATEVLSAYAASFVLLAGIVIVSWRRSVRVKRELEKRDG